MPTEALTNHPDPALFLDFLDPNLSLLDLADRHQLALDDLLDWSESPDTHQRLTRLHTLITFRNSYLAAEKLPIALTSLTAAATQTAPPDADPALALRTTESARRAATQLARLASLAPAKARAVDPSRATDHLAPQMVGAPAAPTPDEPQFSARAADGTAEPAGSQTTCSEESGISPVTTEVRAEDVSDTPVPVHAAHLSDPCIDPHAEESHPTGADPLSSGRSTFTTGAPAMLPPARAAAHHGWS